MGIIIFPKIMFRDPHSNEFNYNRIIAFVTVQVYFCSSEFVLKQNLLKLNRNGCLELSSKAL